MAAVCFCFFMLTVVVMFVVVLIEKKYPPVLPEGTKACYKDMLLPAPVRGVFMTTCMFLVLDHSAILCGFFELTKIDSEKQFRYTVAYAGKR